MVQFELYMQSYIHCSSSVHPLLFPSLLKLLQGFGLTIGSDFFLVLDNQARRNYYRSSIPSNLNYTHGHFVPGNGSQPGLLINGVMGIGKADSYLPAHTVKSEILLPSSCCPIF